MIRHRLPAVLIVLGLIRLTAADDSGLLPAANRVEVKTVAAHLLAPDLAAGGVLGHYKDASGPYDMMVARQASNEKAAFLLLDVKKRMGEPHYLPNMGGFAGMLNGKPFYVLAKGPFVAAVSGKKEAQADTLARILAGRLPLR